MVVLLLKTLSQIIDNNYGMGQLTSEVLDQYIKTNKAENEYPELYPLLQNKKKRYEKAPIYNQFIKPYLESILGKDYNTANLNSQYSSKRLKNNSITSLPSLKGINGKFFMRYKSDSDNLSYILNKNNINIDNSTKTLTANQLGIELNTLNKIIDKNQLDIIETKETSNDKKVYNIYERVKAILKKLSDVINDETKKNIAFWIYPTVSTKNPIEPTLISQNKIVDEQIYINVTIEYIPENIYNIYFDEMILVDINKKTVNTIITDKDILGLYVKDINVEKYKEEEIKKISFNPYDKNVDLPVIIIEDNNKNTKKYLLGNAPNYNLYIDDDNENNLVGCLRFTNKEDREAIVYWCKDYKF